MTLNFILTENDYLQHQLYVVFKNDRMKQQRLRAWLIYTGVLFLLSFMFYDSGNRVFTYYFLALGIACLFFFPLYQKRQHKNYFQKLVVENYRNRFGLTITIHFGDECIETRDATGESKINIRQIENIAETGSYFFIKMKHGGHLIIPKQTLDDIEYVRHELEKICDRLVVDFVDDLQWK